MKVLIVDDDPALRTLVSRVVRTKCPEVVCSVDGLEAISIIAKERFGLIFMDIEMPRMNGIAASRVIRQRYPDIKIVANTSFSRDDARLKCNTDLFDDYIQKGIKGYSAQVTLSVHFHQSQ